MTRLFYYLFMIFLFAMNSKKLLQVYKNKLSYKFKMKDVGKVENYIGINIEYDHEHDNIFYTESEVAYRVLS